ncbi:hypothetical protein, partial [Acinetobacter haemolyticus]|uniref:hypothetical protein n=1 Tax=Acinetobacter haemolyticus TaxID=29430 RepID=UPI00055253F6
ENYIAEKAFTDRFVQQSPNALSLQEKDIYFSYHPDIKIHISKIYINILLHYKSDLKFKLIFKK